MNHSISNKAPRSALARPWPGYAFAVVVVTVATLIRLAFDPVVGDNYPFTIYFAAVTVVAWFGHTGASVAALFLSGVVSLYLFIPPRYSFAVSDPSALAGLILFVAVGGVIVTLSHVTRVARTRAERLLAEACVLQEELRRLGVAEAEHRERLRTTLASIGDAVISTDVRGNVTYMNPVAEVLTGWSNEAAKGLLLSQVFRIVNESTRLEVENPALRALREGVIVGLANHTILIAKDGTERPIDDSAAPIRCKEGELVGCVLVFRDITERHRAEAKNREAQLQISSTLESITDGFSRFDRDWRITYVNAEAQRLTGVDRSALIGMSHWEAFPAAIGTIVEAEYRRAVVERVTVEFEHFFKPLGRWFSVKADPTPDGGLAVFFRDITERKRADERLRESEERFRLAADAVNGIIYEYDYATGQVERTRGLEEVLGYRPEQVPPTAAWWADQMHPDDRSRLASTDPDTIQGGRSVTEYRVRHKDGRWLHVEDRAVLIRDDGKPVRMFGCTVDITERKQTEEEVRRRAEEFQVLLDTLPVGVFVAHDPEGRTITGNRASQELLRSPARNLSLTASPDEQPSNFRVCRNGVELPPDQLPVQRAARGEVVANEELEIVFEDGEVVNELISAAPLYDADGRVRGAVAGVLDISTRKKTEVRLRESEEKYRTLFESMDEGYCVIEMQFDSADRPVNWRFLEVNPAFEKHNGLSNAAGRTILDLAPELEASWFETYGRVARTGESIRFVSESRALGRWFDLYAFRVGGEGSNKVAVLFKDITARQRAEQAVRASEARLRTALTAARMVAWEWTPADGKLRVSENAAEVFGLPAGVGLTGIDQGLALLHPDDAAAYRATFQKAIDDRTGYLTLYRLIRPDSGRVIWIEERGHTVFDGPNDSVRLYGVAMDLTDRHEAEAERERLLKEVEAERGRLVDVFRQAPAFMCVTRGPDHHFEMANDRYFTLVGQRDILGKTVREALPEVEEQGFIDLLDGVYSTGEPFIGTGVRLLLAQVGERFVDFVYKPLRDPDGTVVGIVVVGVDVTARHQAVEALRVSEERFRTLFETMDEGFCVVEMEFDPTGRAIDYRIEVMNPAFEKHTGMHGLVGKSIRQAIPSLEEFWFETYGKVASTGETTQFVHQAEPMGGRWFDVSAFRLGRDGSNRVAILFNDISARRQAEAEREELVGQLREHDRRKDEFLATLAHELRNPLAPIRNGLQVIRMAGSNGTVERARSMMERQLGQMVRLVDDLLDVSRITRGKLELRRERIELKAVIDAAVETARPVIETAGHEFVTAVPDEPIFLDGDLTRLAQVLSNLLTNSAKYTHRGGHVRLGVTREDGLAVLTVTDDGIGIPPNMLGRVFDMFTQVDRTLEKTTGGLGIGLSLVKGLVEMHGGTVEARSEGEGKGSEFVVRLPHATLALDGIDGSHGRAEEVVMPGLCRLLVVDDNRDSADSLGQLLEMLGNEVRMAYDGEEGVRTAAVFRPAVVLCDIGMPRLNGYEAARRIRSEPWGKQMVLIALTGWGQEDDRHKSAEAGFDYHLVKPVETAVLMKLLAGLEAKTM